MLRNGVNYRQDNWTEILDYALLALNDAPDPQLGGRSSLYYERGFNPIKPVDIIDTLKIKGSIDTCPTEVKERLKYIQDMRNMVRDAIHEAERSVYHVYYNEKRRDDKSIKVGSLVRLNLDHIGLHLFKRRKSKLNPLWYGPFKVIAQPSTVSFKLELPEDTRIHDTFHVSKLKLATDVSYSELASKRIHIPTDKSHEGDYEVNKILDHDFNKVDKKWYYLISYKGYHELFDSTWEPREFLDGAKEIRDAYDKENGIFVDDQKSEEGGGAKSQKRKRKTN